MKRLIENSKLVLVVLVVSLAVNVFLVTLLATELGKTSPRHKWQDLQALEERLVSRLGDQDAEILRRGLRAHQSDLSQRMTAFKEARDKVKKALQAEPFVPSALASAFTEARSTMQSLQEAVQSAILQAATEMSATGRQQIYREDRR